MSLPFPQPSLETTWTLNGKNVSEQEFSDFRKTLTIKPTFQDERMPRSVGGGTTESLFVISVHTPFLTEHQRVLRSAHIFHSITHPPCRI